MKKLGLIAAILFVFLAAVYIVTPKKHSTTKKSTTAQTTIKQNPSTQAQDKQMVSNMKDMLNIITNYYTVHQVAYPDGNADGWAQVMREVPTTDAFTSPYNHAFFKYSKGDPDFSSIQYAPGYDCTSSNNFIKGNFRSMALRGRTVAGFRCVDVDIQKTSDGSSDSTGVPSTTPNL